jgi:transcriptional regulator with XRE-family HTH domain
MDPTDPSTARGAASEPEHVDLVDPAVGRLRLIARLVERRKANGLTQATVAGLMGVGQSVVAEIESGRADVRVSTLARYADATSRGELQLELAPDAPAGGQAGRVSEALAPYSPAVESADFWSPSSLDDLAEEQGNVVIIDPADLALEGIAERDWDAFFAVIDPAE